MTREKMRDRIAEKVHLLECGCSQPAAECQPTRRITDAILDDLWPEVQQLLERAHQAEVRLQALGDLIAGYDSLPGNAYIPIGVLRAAAGRRTMEERTLTTSDPIIYSTTGEAPEDPESELEVNTLRDGTVIVSNSELDRPVAEVAAGLWRQQAERLEREMDRMGRMYDDVCAERDALKAAIEGLRQPYAMTNAEMSELCAACIQSDCCKCGEVYRRYFLRVVLGGSAVSAPGPAAMEAHAGPAASHPES